MRVLSSQIVYIMKQKGSCEPGPTRCGRHEIATNLPQEPTPYRIQPQVDGSCALATSSGSPTVPGTAAAISLTALWPAQCICSALLGAVESHRRNCRKAPQEHTPHRMQPQVDGSCAPTTSHRPLTVPGTAATRLLRALYPVQWRRSACSPESELRRRNRDKLAARAHTASDPASSRRLLRLGRITQTSERDRNRCHALAASAVAGFSASAVLCSTRSSVGDEIAANCRKSTHRIGCSLKSMAPAPRPPHTDL
jgi:hypothetical protein